MKKINLPKLVLGIFLTTSLSVFTVTLCQAYGETGCTNNGYPQGLCLKNTEGTYTCWAISGASGDLACSSS